MVQDVIFAMILNVPALRTKLQVILDNPSLIGAEISKVYAERRPALLDADSRLHHDVFRECSNSGIRHAEQQHGDHVPALCAQMHPDSHAGRTRRNRGAGHAGRQFQVGETHRAAADFRQEMVLLLFLRSLHYV